VAACALGRRNGSVSNPATRRSTDPPPHRLLSTLCNRDLPHRRDAPRDPGTLTTLLATLPPHPPQPYCAPDTTLDLLRDATSVLFRPWHGLRVKRPTHRYIEDFTTACALVGAAAGGALGTMAYAAAVSWVGTLVF
jgi:hypothetical protein